MKQSLSCIIVDNESGAVYRMECILKNFDYIDILASHTQPEKALKDIRELAPDIVFLDIEMPEKSGMEMADEIRQMPESPVIIFITAFDHYAIQAIKKAAFDYLVKPVDIDDLKETFNRLRNESASVKRNKYNKWQRQLSEREQDVFPFLAEGRSSAQIADALHISKHTADTHRRSILRKLQVRSTAELIAKVHKSR